MHKMNPSLSAPKLILSLGLGLLTLVRAQATISIQPGDILLANYGGNSLLKIDPSSGATFNLGSYLVPTDVAFSASGDIFISEWGGKIKRLNLASEVVSVINPTETFSELWGLALDSHGDLYVTGKENDTFGVFKVNTATGASSLISGGGHLSSPKGIDFLDGDHLVVSSLFNDEVVRVALKDGSQTVWNDPNLDQPWGIAVRGANIYVSCYDGSKIMKISANSIEEVVSGLDANPYGLGVDGQGNILAGINAGGSSAVAKISPSGSVLENYSGGGIGWVTGIEVAPAAVPEPEAWVGAVGMIALAYAGLKKRPKPHTFPLRQERGRRE